MIIIDGSQGEGGGQILRSALSLSLCTGQPFQMTKIRAGRKKPGILRQHLTAIRAAEQVGSADVSGAEIGSSELTFRPGKVKAGEYHFAVGTAGSATLVFQTILPALMTASGDSTVICEGGTHNPFAPPYDFLEKSFLPILRKMGVQVDISLQRPGFYPAGGGKFTAVIHPIAKLQPLEFNERGNVTNKWAKALIADLSDDIAKRQLAMAAEKLNWPGECFAIERTAAGTGPGNVLLLGAEYEHVTEIVAGFGEKGVSSSKVVHTAVEQMHRYMASTAAVGEHLADQLLIPFALAGGGSFTTTAVTNHTRTNADVIKLFGVRAFVLTQVNVSEWKVQ